MPSKKSCQAHASFRLEDACLRPESVTHHLLAKGSPKHGFDVTREILVVDCLRSLLKGGEYRQIPLGDLSGVDLHVF